MRPRVPTMPSAAHVGAMSHLQSPTSVRPWPLVPLASEPEHRGLVIRREAQPSSVRYGCLETASHVHLGVLLRSCLTLYNWKGPQSRFPGNCPQTGLRSRSAPNAAGGDTTSHSAPNIERNTPQAGTVRTGVFGQTCERWVARTTEPR